MGIFIGRPKQGRLLLAFACLALIGSTAACATDGTIPSRAGLPTVSASASPTPTTQATVTPSPTQTETPTPTAAPTPQVYSVARGDSLSLIAARYDTTWQSLVYWNGSQYPTLDPATPGYNPNHLELGWQLTVWPGVVVAYNPPLATPAPTLPSSTASVVVSHGNRTSTMVALTFDMGGRTESATSIMGWLRDHKVPATVFLTGSSVDSAAAAREVISIVNARADLYDLGNHSYSHPDMTDFTAAQVADQLRRAEVAIARYAAQSPRPLFRPPYGAWNSQVLVGAGSAGYRWTVLWDVDTLDWKPIADGGPTATQIVQKVIGNALGGSIVLMHLGGYETLNALPGIVDGLHARGFTLVTLAALIGN